MNQVVILTIGDELINGRVVDRNSSTLAGRLYQEGIETPLHLTCGDDHEEIGRCLEVALSKAPVVITTGGLGPTPDDLTHEAIARYAGVALELDEDELGSGRSLPPAG